MSGWLPEIEGWVKLAGVLVGLVMAILVPVRSWIVEDRRYRAQMMDAAASAGRTVSAAVASGPVEAGALCHRLEMEALIAALRDCASAIRDTTRQERARRQDRLAEALDRLMDQR